jgi:outer membrane protein assembly factor BamB
MALEADTGEPLWRHLTGGEVRSDAIVDPASGAIYFASADGHLYALGRDGQLLWRVAAGSPIYGSPTLAADVSYCGTSTGEIIAVSARSGDVLWRCGEPEYAIETAPCVGEGRVFAGSWDRFVYGVDAATGILAWRAPSKGSDRSGAARYYSPADCGPAWAGGRLFVADRAYQMTVFDGATGERLLDEAKCVAVGAGADGEAAYVRHTDGRVSKRRPDGGVVWTAHVPTGSLATPPETCNGRVLAISTLGTLSVLDDRNGAVIAQYKAFPDLYAFSRPVTDGDRVYVADLSGNVLCLKIAIES